jgi:hypothetical protein
MGLGRIGEGCGELGQRPIKIGRPRCGSHGIGFSFQLAIMVHQQSLTCNHCAPSARIRCTFLEPCQNLATWWIRHHHGLPRLNSQTGY